MQVLYMNLLLHHHLLSAGNTNFVPVIPVNNGAVPTPTINVFKINFVNPQFTNFVATGANIGTFQMLTATAPIKYYIEFAVSALIAVVPPAVVDTYQIGISSGNSAANAFANADIADNAGLHTVTFNCDPFGTLHKFNKTSMDWTNNR